MEIPNLKTSKTLIASTYSTLNHTGLIIGEIYKITITAYTHQRNSSSNTEENFLYIYNGGTLITFVEVRGTPGGVREYDTLTDEVVFKATATDINTSGSYVQDGSWNVVAGNTFTTLEHLKNYQETTDFT